MSADQLEGGVALEAAHQDEAGETERAIEGAADQLREAEDLHLLRADRDPGRVHEHGDIELSHLLEEWLGAGGIEVLPGRAGVDHDALEAELLDGALGLLKDVVAAKRD